ncbi:unnamed protein product [Polarella glacialis]|uniref:Cation/H+ exchanger transmembrane domain-containing protein n=1 Tax=Polarella glacialis TaxID=89957 RepID=A0A813ERL9_POLGL|nr:unnamed protein product [Polarella glacialis]
MGNPPHIPSSFGDISNTNTYNKNDNHSRDRMKGPDGGDGPPWKMMVFTLMLMTGLVGSQVAALKLSRHEYHSWVEVVEKLTMLCLSFIMVNVGYEFNVDKSNIKSYAKDYLVAMTAAGFPWILVAAWFLYALPGPVPFGSALVAASFAAPTSAGILFSMLEAAGLKETWLFKKAQILAIFDDLGTILLMIPLKIVVEGFKWELTADAAIMLLLLCSAYVKLHELKLPSSSAFTMLYSVLIVGFCEGMYFVTDRYLPMDAIRISVLLPAFTMGCITQVDHHAQSDTEERIKTVISTCFMLLVGLSMPSLFIAGSDHLSFQALAGHVLAVSLLMILGKMFLLFCYKDESDLRTRLGLALGMCPRGEVGAGVIVISLNMGISGPIITIAVISLAINLVLSSGFIVAVKHLARPPQASKGPPRKRSAKPATVAFTIMAITACIFGAVQGRRSNGAAQVFTTWPMPPGRQACGTLPAQLGGPRQAFMVALPVYPQSLH